MFVPAGLTPLLQPLDTHVFARLKDLLAKGQNVRRAATPDGTLPPTEWIDAASEAVKRVLTDADWTSAMLSNGIADGHGPTRVAILEAFQPEDLLPVGRPTAAELDELVGSTGGSFGPRAIRTSTLLLERAAAPIPIVHAPVVRARRLLPPPRGFVPWRPPPPLPPPVEAGPDGIEGGADMPLRRTRSGALY